MYNSSGTFIRKLKVKYYYYKKKNHRKTAKKKKNPQLTKPLKYK